MPHALELVSGRATAPGATLTSLTMATGNSNTVRNADLSSLVALIGMWGYNATAGITRVRSPKLHDNVQGIRMRVPANSPDPMFTMGTWQRLIPQDTLTLEISGGTASEIDQQQLLIYYSDLPGNAARFIDVPTLLAKTVNVWTTEIPITPGVLGGYSGQVAINSAFDNFKANTDYALVGYAVDVMCGAVRFTSPDFSNLGIGGPGVVAGAAGQTGVRWLTERWFYHLSQQLNIPLIPVFNAANKFGTLVDIVQNNGGAAVNVTAILHELANANTTPNPMLK